MKLRNQIFVVGIFLISLIVQAQTPFKKGVRLPQATEAISADSIPVMDGRGVINSYIAASNLTGVDINQDNIYRAIEATSVDFEMQSLVDAINALPEFTITETDIVFFKIGQTNDPSMGFIVATLKDLGKGTYGSGGTVLTINDINIISTLPLTVGDIEGLASTQVIDLGNIGVSSIEDGFNAHTFTGDEDPVQIQDDGYVLVNAIQNGNATQHLFVGLGGEYGTTGSLTSINEDFALLNTEYPIYDVWRDRWGNNIATNYNEFISHEGSVNLGEDLNVTGVVGGPYDVAGGRLLIGGNYGADFIGGNKNHSTYRFNMEAPTGTFPADRTFQNVIIGRNFSFISAATVQNRSLTINPTVDFANTTVSGSSHRSIHINPNYQNEAGADLHAIYSEVGDVYFANGDLYLPDITSGTAVNGLGIDANGKVITASFGGVSDDIPLAGTNVGEPVTGDIEISQTTVTNDAWYIKYGDFDDTDLDYGLIGFNDDEYIRLNRKLNDDDSKIEVFAHSVGIERRDHSTGFVHSILVGDDTPGGIIITDEINNKGLVGDSYYGANYDDNTYTQAKFLFDNFLQLPTEGTNGQVLTTDGSGTYTWEDASGGGTDDQTAAEVVSDDATFDVISGTDVQANLVSADNELYELTPETEGTANASALTLKTGGKNYNILTAESANTNTSFTITNSVYRPNQYARIKINVSSQPTFPAGVNQEGGVPFQADTDLYMIVWSKGTSVNDVVFYFIPFSVQASSYDIKYVPLYISDATSDITVGTSKGGHYRMMYGGTLLGAEVSLGDPGTVQGISIDILKDGVSITSTELTTDATEDFSEDATTPPVFSDTSLPYGSKLTVDVTQVPTGATNGIVYLIIQPL